MICLLLTDLLKSLYSFWVLIFCPLYMLQIFFSTYYMCFNLLISLVIKSLIFHFFSFSVISVFQCAFPIFLLFHILRNYLLIWNLFGDMIAIKSLTFFPKLISNYFNMVIKINLVLSMVVEHSILCIKFPLAHDSISETLYSI